MDRTRDLRHEHGFSLIEIMVVVLIIGVLVAIAIPVYAGAGKRAEQRTCFSNQRIVESTAQSWSADYNEDLAPLEGVVDGDHPLIDDYILREPPRCPSAPEPADIMTVDVAHGAYELDNNGNVAPCGHGDPVHGDYN